MGKVRDVGPLTSLGIVKCDVATRRLAWIVVVIDIIDPAVTHRSFDLIRGECIVEHRYLSMQCEDAFRLLLTKLRALLAGVPVRFLHFTNLPSTSTFASFSPTSAPF